MSEHRSEDRMDHSEDMKWRMSEKSKNVVGLKARW